MSVEEGFENQRVTPRPSLPGPTGPEVRRRQLFLAFWTSCTLLALYAFREVLLPFFLAVVVAYVLAPVVGALERLRVGGRKPPRWVSVVLVYVGLLGALGLFGALGVPRLAVEIEKLTREAPRTLATLRDEWVPVLEHRFREAMAPYQEPNAPPPLPDEPEGADAVTGAAAVEAPEGIRITPIGPGGQGGYQVLLPPDGVRVTPEGEGYRITTAHHPEEKRDLSATVADALRRATENTQQHAVTLLRTAQAVTRAVVRGVFTFFIMLMLSAYMLITKDAILGFFRSLWRPERRAGFDLLVTRIDRGLSGVVRGQLLICLVNGVLSGIGFYLLDLPYWPVLTLIATVLSIIPIFGAILSSVPAVVVGLQLSPMTALLTLAWIVGIHQIEANLLNPKIMGDAAKVHPVLVVFALLAGEHVFGIAGALLAVPVLSIAQSLFLHFRESVLGVPGPRSTSMPPPPPGQAAV